LNAFPDVSTRSAMSRPSGVSHLAMVTADLDRYRVFYEDTIGVDIALVLAAGPGHGRQAIAFVGDAMFHVFEPADQSVAPQRVGAGMFERGHLDHFGLTVPNVGALTELRHRLIEVGASSGDIRPLGPMLSIRFLDPDGFEGEINCLNPDFDPSALRDADAVIDPHWLERTRRVLQTGDVRNHHR
jgi:hypothetical protein